MKCCILKYISLSGVHQIKQWPTIPAKLRLRAEFGLLEFAVEDEKERDFQSSEED